ncbi:alpha/beta hydrolase fold domain-containing protein [Streptomyces sp. NPDC001642]|uniref:alpha/beta hydrolase fold domain-containing protein n=1 Tax=Streptomyces sp. NPDC001642 TaxID=3154392 RepID=UPI00387EE377
MHGGAYAIGSAADAARLAAEVSRRTGAHAVGVDYRLAPEHPFPAAVDDALAVYQAVLDDRISSFQSPLGHPIDLSPHVPHLSVVPLRHAHPTGKTSDLGSALGFPGHENADVRRRAVSDFAPSARPAAPGFERSRTRHRVVDGPPIHELSRRTPQAARSQAGVVEASARSGRGEGGRAGCRGALVKTLWMRCRWCRLCCTGRSCGTWGRRGYVGQAVRTERGETGGGSARPSRPAQAEERDVHAARARGHAGARAGRGGRLG